MLGNAQLFASLHSHHISYITARLHSPLFCSFFPFAMKPKEKGS